MKWTRSILLLALPLCLLTAKPLSAEECGFNYRCQEALVKFSRHLRPADIEGLLRKNQAHIIRRFPLTRLYHLSFPADQATAAWIASFRQEPGVLLATANDNITVEALPNDPSFNLLWGLKNTGQTGGSAGVDIDAESAWGSVTDGSGVLVAIVDTGIDYEHPDLAANIWINPGEVAGNGLDDDGNGFVDDVHGYDFANDDGDPMDDHDHGTHVTGILGAVGNNGVGVAGAAWTAKIMAVKFLDAGANGSASTAISAIEYALANGAKIINGSWGSGAFNAGLQSAILEADSQGALLFLAAGNQGRNIDANPFYPASFNLPNIVSLTSINDDDTLSSFSNFGLVSVDLAAPGGEVYSTKPDNTYGFISGTSMAAPYAAGVAALLWTEFPERSHRQIRNLILQGAEPRAYLAGVTVMGGLLNLSRSLDVALDPANQIPEANAGSDRSLELGTAVTLNGTASDGDGDFPLSFDWQLSVPPGSLSRLDSLYSQNPVFVPDQEGEYIATLTVNDSLSSSVPDSVSVTVAGGSLPLPTVVIRASYKEAGGSIQQLGAGETTPRGAKLTLRGNESTSLFPDSLLFAWELVAKPAGSTAELSASEAVKTDFIPDLSGTYTVRLRVEDGYNENFGEISLVASNPLPNSPSPNPTNPAVPNMPGTGGCSLYISR